MLTLRTDRRCRAVALCTTALTVQEPATVPGLTHR